MNMQQPAPPNTPVSSYEVPSSVQNVGNSISETYNDVSQSIKNSIDGFSTPAEAGEGASQGCALVQRIQGAGAEGEGLPHHLPAHRAAAESRTDCALS